MSKLSLFYFIFLVFNLTKSLAGETDKNTIRNPMERFFLKNVDFKLADAVESDVIYKYFKSVTTVKPTVLTKETVKNANMSKKMPTTYLIHGFTKDDTDPWYKPFKDGLFLLGVHNVIYINWAQAAGKSYDVSAANAKPVGEYIADFILSSGVPLKNVHLVGHSLGAQVAGFVGKSVFNKTGRKISRITGLDPAGPKFDYPVAPPENRLCDTDADFVDIVHTDIQGYGYTPPMGHIDFYPNNGTDQPGCPKEHFNVHCHHARATFLFEESFSTIVDAKEAEYFEDNNFRITIKPKENPKTVNFGHFVDQSARGIYTFITNGDQPFLIV